MNDTQIDDLLRSLDPAEQSLSPDARARADARLESILSEPVSLTAVRERKRRKAPWLIGAAATLAVGIIAAQALTGGSSRAYATWTPMGAPVAPAHLSQVETACLDNAREWGSAPVPDGLTPLDLRLETARTIVSERRGDVVFVAMTTDSGAAFQCLATPDVLGNFHVRSSTAGVPHEGNEPEPALGPNEVTTAGAGANSDGEQYLAFTVGRVGANVTGVTLHSEGRTIQATVSGGNYAAWWPTSAPTGPMWPGPQFTVDATLADGTVLPSVAASDAPAAPGPREIGQVTRGGSSVQGQALSVVTGTVGADVVGVTVHLDGDHVAAITDGQFEVSWPSEAGVAPGEYQPATYTLTLADGTVLAHVKPISGADA